MAASLRTRSNREALAKCLTEEWDAIVLDNYATVWALGSVLSKRSDDRRLVVVHVSHNFESALAESLVVAFKGSWAKKLVLLCNSWKIRYWERRLVEKSDVVSTITDEDAEALREMSRRHATHLTLTPGYSGYRATDRDLPASKRRVVLVGSFRWIVKQENLRQLLDLSDSIFYQNGIELDVVGHVPEELIESYKGRLRATEFHGFVDDYSKIFSAARIAIVPEIIGGGFKLKILDYIFGGLPVASLEQASAGLPLAIRNNFITSETLEGLINKIVESIDDVKSLDRMQTDSASAAAGLFDWTDRGRALHAAIAEKIGTTV